MTPPTTITAVSYTHLDVYKRQGNHLGNLGIAYRNLGQVERAIELYEAALALSLIHI